MITLYFVRSINGILTQFTAHITVKIFNNFFFSLKNIFIFRPKTKLKWKMMKIWIELQDNRKPAGSRGISNIIIYGVMFKVMDLLSIKVFNVNLPSKIEF